MKNKRLQALLEELLGSAAAEPVHTDEAAKEHTPELDNKDILVGQHAEEVEEVIVEAEEVVSDEEHKEIADAGEYDYEGDMAKSQLRVILDAAQELHDKLGDQDNLPEWVQSKITLAKEYIDTARDYMKSEHKEAEVVVESEHVDYEGKMAKVQLKSIIKHAQELHDKLEDESQLPAWVQDKLSIADHNIEASNSYHEKKEVVQESYSKEELLELFEALNLDTNKYTFNYLAEQLGFQPLNEGVKDFMSSMGKGAKDALEADASGDRLAKSALSNLEKSDETGNSPIYKAAHAALALRSAAKKPIAAVSGAVSGAKKYFKDKKENKDKQKPIQESYSKEELLELFEALELDTYKYTFDYLAEELGFAAAEPIATSDAEPKVLKVSLANSEVYDKDSHEQAEEVEEVLVEGMRGRPSFKSLRVAPKGAVVVGKDGNLEKIKKLQKKA